VRLQIKVVPGSSREAVEWLGELLKVRVRAAPENGKANAAVEALLARRLGLPANAVRIVAGFGSALKAVEISGYDPESLRARLGQP
jgi:hypothetical protein